MLKATLTFRAETKEGVKLILVSCCLLRDRSAKIIDDAVQDRAQELITRQKQITGIDKAAKRGNQASMGKRLAPIGWVWVGFHAGQFPN